MDDLVGLVAVFIATAVILFAVMTSIISAGALALVLGVIFLPPFVYGFGQAIKEHREENGGSA